MQLPDELNSKRQDPEDEYKTKMYQSLLTLHLILASKRWTSSGLLVHFRFSAIRHHIRGFLHHPNVQVFSVFLEGDEPAKEKRKSRTVNHEWNSLVNC